MSKSEFIESVRAFSSVNIEDPVSRNVFEAHSVYTKFLRYGDRDAARHWVVRNRARYGYKVVKHDSDAFSCFCLADYTTDDHDCSLCQCYKCTNTDKYDGFPTIPKYRDVVQNCLSEIKQEELVSDSDTLLRVISGIYYDERSQSPKRSLRKIYNKVLFKILDLYSNHFEVDFYMSIAFEDGCSVPIGMYLDGSSMLRLIMEGVDISDAFNQALTPIPETREQVLFRQQQSMLMLEHDEVMVTKSKDAVSEIISEPTECVMCQEEVTHFVAVCTTCKVDKKDGNTDYKALYHIKCLRKWFHHNNNMRCGYCRKENYLWI